MAARIKATGLIHHIEILPASHAKAMFGHPDPLHAPFQLSACTAVANGRLYILDGSGKFDQIIEMWYWHGDDLIIISDQGVAWDENGDLVHDWRNGRQQR